MMSFRSPHGPHDYGQADQEQRDDCLGPQGHRGHDHHLRYEIKQPLCGSKVVIAILTYVFIYCYL